MAKWTIEEYHRLIEIGILASRQVELIEGEIVEMSPESPFHAYVTEGTAKYLQNLLQDLALVREAHPITLSHSEPEPDLAIVKLPRQQYKTRHPYPSDIFWLVEISQATLDYDLNEKKQLYAKAGIQEYWVIDIKASQIYVFHQSDGENYQFSTVVNQGYLTPLAFPNVQISVTQLFGNL